MRIKRYIVDQNRFEMGRVITAVIHVIQENVNAFDSQICNVWLLHCCEP